LKTTPTAEKTLRSFPWQSGHVVSASSLNFCTASRPLPHSVHWYWYVGTFRFLLSLPLALSRHEC